MNLRICPKCKEAKDWETGKWCTECKAKYHNRLVELGKKKKAENAARLPKAPDVVATKPMERLVALAKRSGILRTQAIYTNNAYKWKMFFDNEAELEKEMGKWTLTLKS